MGCSTDSGPPPGEGGPRDGDIFDQRSGSNCFACHTQFRVAGTIKDRDVARVELTDRNGVEARMVPNEHGNFFRHHLLEPPFDVRIVYRDGRVRKMDEAPHGSCNACHHDLPGGRGAL
jgi:hypothetical protein